MKLNKEYLLDQIEAIGFDYRQYDEVQKKHEAERLARSQALGRTGKYDHTPFQFYEEYNTLHRKFLDTFYNPHTHPHFGPIEPSRYVTLSPFTCGVAEMSLLKRPSFQMPQSEYITRCIVYAMLNNRGQLNYYNATGLLGLEHTEEYFPPFGFEKGVAFFNPNSRREVTPFLVHLPPLRELCS